MLVTSTTAFHQIDGDRKRQKQRKIRIVDVAFAEAVDFFGLIQTEKQI